MKSAALQIAIARAIAGLPPVVPLTEQRGLPAVPPASPFQPTRKRVELSKSFQRYRVVQMDDADPEAPPPRQYRTEGPVLYVRRSDWPKLQAALQRLRGED